MIYIGRELNIPVYSGIALMGSNLARLYSFPVKTYVFQSGEKNKNFRTLEDLLVFMADCKLCRSDYLYAVGGGVTADIGGLAAALYNRGMKLINVPTTLTAMVDASIGGKNAVNLSEGKNLVGTFKQPDDIYIDLNYLDTLPKRIYNEGMAEVIKYSFICGEDLTTLPLEEMVKKCVEIKEEFVRKDEFDLGERHILNFGHTIGHAVENDSNYSYLHGESVAIGMVYITQIFNPDLLPRLKEMLGRFDLPTEYGGSIDFSLDKKRNGDSIDIVIPKAFGDCEIQTIKTEELNRLCKLT